MNFWDQSFIVLFQEISQLMFGGVLGLYKDSFIEIEAEGVRLTGLTLPRLSHVHFQFDEVKSIKKVKLKWTQKLLVLGTNNLNTWWTFDSFRFLKDSGFVAEVKGFPLKIGFTVSNPKRVAQLLKENLGKSFEDTCSSSSK